MNRTIILLLIMIYGLPAWAQEFMPNYEPAKNWIGKNNKSVTEIFKMLEKEPDGASLWLLGDNLIFERMEGERRVKYIPSNVSKYSSLAPKNSNVFFSIRNGNYFLESGTGSLCGNTQCLQQIVQFRAKTETMSCTRQNIEKPSSKCTYPLMNDWFVLYLKLGLDSNYEKIGE